jgi:ABC-type multidrug transport system fused ATPase/permease subunit
MMKILRVLLVGMLLFVVVTVAAFVYLKWWQALIVVIALIFAIVLGVKLILRNLGKMLGDSMLKMFEIKSQVLRGATAEVHSIEATTAPPEEQSADDEDADEEGENDEEDSPAPPEAPRNFYRIDATITPPPQAGPMAHWDVDDLRVVEFDKPSLTLAQMSEDGADVTDGYNLRDLKIFEEGQFIEDQMGKHLGPKRIRAVVGVPVHVRELKFMYYNEYFGQITLPPPMPQLG